MPNIESRPLAMESQISLSQSEHSEPQKSTISITNPKIASTDDLQMSKAYIECRRLNGSPRRLLKANDYSHSNCLTKGFGCSNYC